MGKSVPQHDLSTFALCPQMSLLSIAYLTLRVKWQPGLYNNHQQVQNKKTKLLANLTNWLFNCTLLVETEKICLLSNKSF